MMDGKEHLNVVCVELNATENDRIFQKCNEMLEATEQSGDRGPAGDMLL